MPLVCPQCYEAFDLMTDRPQRIGQIQRKAPAETPVKNEGQRRSPLKRAEVDRSQLMLVCLKSGTTIFPESGRPNLLGQKDGIAPQFFRRFSGISALHCVVEHDDAGWSIRFLNGKSQLNGRWIDVGDRLPLRHGDILSLGEECHLQVRLETAKG